MRRGILSDIHGNLEAFDAVKSDIERHSLDEVICLGDMVGYGPDPDEVVRGVRNLQCQTVLGNHETALFSEKARNRMNFQAKENSVMTQQLLSTESLAYCGNLPLSLHLQDAWFVHGYPPDSASIYLFNQSDAKLQELFAAARASLYFVGHTHDLQLITHQQGQIRRSRLTEGRIALEKGNAYIVNVGSVGQPRDGGNRAKYVIWDDLTGEMEIRFIPYDIKKTMNKIYARGFPAIYAERLA